MINQETQESAPMLNRDVLINLLLKHWQTHQPKMYQQFQQENRLQEELEAAAERYAESLFDLTVVKKVPYPAAEEMVKAELLHGEPEEESNQTV